MARGDIEAGGAARPIRTAWPPMQALESALVPHTSAPSSMPQRAPSPQPDPPRHGARRAWPVAVAVLAVAALALFAWRERAAGGDAAPGMPASPAAHGAPAPAPDAVAAQTGSPEAARHPASGPATPRERFEREDDLLAYWRELHRSARDGDAEAAWLMSKVADYCAPYGADPAAYARDTLGIESLRVRGSGAMVAARARIERRCRGFTSDDGLTPALVRQLRDKAAHAGSLPAEAALLASGSPLEGGPDYARDLIERVRASRDADAFNALSPAMGNRVFAAAASPAVPAQFGELAWRLAACRLGMACGSESNLMTSYCANGGICSRNPAQGFEEFVYDAAIPNQGIGVVRDMVETLVAPAQGAGADQGEGEGTTGGET